MVLFEGKSLDETQRGTAEMKKQREDMERMNKLLEDRIKKYQAKGNLGFVTTKNA